MSTHMQELDSRKSGHARMFQIVVFRLGQEDYALPIGQIKEVVKTPSITPMPQSPRFISGVANIRGNIIAIVDLQERFGLNQVQEGQEQKGNYTLVVESDDFKMGVLVRDVPNTLAIDESSIDQTMIGGDEQGYIKGIVKLEKRLIILIDIFKVITQKDTVQPLQKAAAMI